MLETAPSSPLPAQTLTLPAFTGLVPWKSSREAQSSIMTMKSKVKSYNSDRSLCADGKNVWKWWETMLKKKLDFYLNYKQYLNCKILHEGTLLQPWPNAFGLRKYFSENNVIPSPKLNEDQKKGLRRKLKCFFFEIRWRPKKEGLRRQSKFFSLEIRRRRNKKKGLRRNLGLYSAGIWDLFVLADSFSSDHSALKSRWGTPKSRWGDAKPRWRDVSPLQFKYWL